MVTTMNHSNTAAWLPKTTMHILSGGKYGMGLSDYVKGDDHGSNKHNY